MEDQSRDRHGILVGWSSQGVGERLVLTLQTLDRAAWEGKDNPDRTDVMMTRNQATVLANHLLKVSGASPPPRRKGWLASLFE